VTAIETDGVLDLDVRSVTLSGAVTLNQAPLPAAPADRGSIDIARAPAEGADGASISLGTDSPPSYAVTLAAGRHAFLHAANAALCSGSEPAPAVPCVSQQLIGCPGAP